jgi:hypothetical protein
LELATGTDVAASAHAWKAIATVVLCAGCGEFADDILRSVPVNSGDGSPGDDSGPPAEAADDDGATESGPDAEDSAPDNAAPGVALEAAAPSETTAVLDQRLGPWGTAEPPTTIAALASAFNDDDPTLTSDQLELYFSSTRGTTSTDIYVSKRVSIDAPWGAPALATALSTPDTEDTPEIGPDGLTIWFVRSVKGTTTGRDVYVSTRPTRDAPWAAGRLVPELSSTSEDYAPTPAGDGLSMILSSYRSPSIGADDLFTSRRPSVASPWSTPSWLTGLESTARDSGPFRPGDDTLMYFTTWRSGLQIWRTTRVDATSPWGAPRAVTELSPTPNGAEEPWISPDLRLMVFTLKIPNQPTQIAEVRR